MEQFWIILICIRGTSILCRISLPIGLIDLSVKYFDLWLHLFDSNPLKRELLLDIGFLFHHLLHSGLCACSLCNRRLPLILGWVKLALEGCHTLLKVLIVWALLLEQVNLILQILYALLVRLQVLLELGHVLDLFLVYVNDSCSVLECSDLLLFHVQFILYSSQFLRSLQLISLLLSS